MVTQRENCFNNNNSDNNKLSWLSLIENLITVKNCKWVIPYLEFYFLSMKLNSLDFEINSWKDYYLIVSFVWKVIVELLISEIMVSFKSKINSIFTYSGYEGGVECIVWESKQNAGFSHTTVTNEQQFEQIIKPFSLRCHDLESISVRHQKRKRDS